MFSIEGDEEGWFATFGSPEELDRFLNEYQIFDKCELCCASDNCCSIRLNIDGERALGALRKTADALKYAVGRKDTLARDPEGELEDGKGKTDG